MKKISYQLANTSFRSFGADIGEFKEEKMGAKIREKMGSLRPNASSARSTIKQKIIKDMPSIVNFAIQLILSIICRTCIAKLYLAQ